MRLFLFISLALISQFVFASLDVSDFSDDQICIYAKDPPLSAQVIFEIKALISKITWADRGGSFAYIQIWSSLKSLTSKDAKTN